MNEQEEDIENLLDFIIAYNPKITRDQLEELSLGALPTISTYIEVEIISKMN
jgi:hypothetical protein